MRLIDADKIESHEQLEPYGNGKYEYVRVAYMDDIDALPTMDATPVVRCGECNFWDKDHISCEGLAKCLTGESGVRYRNRSDFCSKGRKRDGGNNDGRQ